MNYFYSFSSRHVKTAPNTPEVESRTFPRHAESTSHLEMTAPPKKTSYEKG